MSEWRHRNSVHRTCCRSCRYLGVRSSAATPRAGKDPRQCCTRPRRGCRGRGSISLRLLIVPIAGARWRPTNTVPNPGLYKPASRPVPGKWPWCAPWPRRASWGRNSESPGGAGAQNAARLQPGHRILGSLHPHASREMAQWMALRCHGRIRCSRGLWRQASFGAGGTVAAGSCRVREHRCRRRRHARASGENGPVDADTWFQTTLPSRKSPNLSNSRACVAAHSLFLL